jgi:hypothetical protein
MSSLPEILFPIDDHLKRLEPVVFLEDGVYVKTRGEGDESSSFVTAHGVVHALRRLIGRHLLYEHLVRRNAGSIRSYLQTEFARARSGRGEDELRYLVEQLLPSFAERDWSTRFSLEAGAGVVPEFSPSERSAIFDTLWRTIPAVFVPTPSVLILGRFRLLCIVSRTRYGYHVRHGGAVLEPTGSEVPVNLVEDGWRAEIRAWLARTVAKLTECNDAGAESATLARARVQIDQQGFFQQGDVLFLPGEPPRVGHVVPRHFNRAIGRDSKRDLAMVAPFNLPSHITHPQVYKKTPEGRWVPLRLPHGLCLGGSPPDIRPESPGLALLAYLRWAAARIAANGAFHASDEPNQCAYDS